MTIIVSDTLAYDMDLASGQIFAAEPFVLDSTITSTPSNVRTLQFSFGDQTQYVFDDFYDPIDSFSRMFLERQILDESSLPIAAISDINIVVSTTSIFDPITSNFAEIFAKSDIVTGSPFDDVIMTLGSNDFITGREGDDLIYGNQAGDLMYGNTGSDTLYGGQDSDVGFGGQGEDIVYGNLGTDVIYGNLADDDLFGGGDNDFLYGGQDSDDLHGNRGNDNLSGGQDADQFWFANEGGNDTILDFEDGIDSIVLANNINGSGIMNGDDAVANAVQSGEDVFVDLGDGNGITISNLQLANLDAGDFLII